LSFDLQNYLRDRKELIDRGLDRYLPRESRHPEIIHKAVRHSVFAGGKRLRPVLLLAGYELFQDDYKRALGFACAVEMLHTYSLIHDDLPAMDNDDFRRGVASSHKLFGEAIAILAGDALQAEAFGLMARSGLESGFSPKTVLDAISDLADAAGMKGMVSGQALDMETQGKSYSEKELEFIHLHKTGALIRASIVTGARLAGGDEKALAALSGFGLKIGLAFQVADDVLDVKGGESLGKPAGSDQKKKKATYVELFGLNRAKGLAGSLISESLELIRDFGTRGEPLRLLARFMVERVN